jgi:hypothetical protein
MLQQLPCQAEKLFIKRNAKRGARIESRHLFGHKKGV